MYKTQLEKSVIGENVCLSVIKERGEEKEHYALLRISLFGRSSYAVCVLGEDYALETVGESEEQAELLFDTVIRESVSPMHIHDVVTDFRHGLE